MKKQTFGSNTWRGIKLWFSGILGGVATLPFYFLIKWIMLEGRPAIAILFGLFALIWFWLASGYTAHKLFGFK